MTIGSVIVLALALVARPSWAVSSHYQEGLKLMQEERYQEAVVAFEQENAENPGSAEVLMNLGWSYWKVNRIDDAWRVFDTLAKLDPKNASYLRMLAQTEIGRKEYKRALRHARQALRLLPGDKDSSLVLASALGGLGRHRQADKILHRLAGRYPNSAAVQFHLGDSWALKGKLQKALRYYDLAVRLAPDNNDYRRVRAGVLYALGNEAAAIAEWKALAAMNPPNEKAILNLAWAAAKDNDLEQAYAYAQRLLKLDPNNPTYLKLAANLELERDEPPDALRLASRAAALSRGDEDAALIEAKALFNLHRDAEAMDALRSLMRRYPKDQRILFSMADFLQGMGRDKEALTLFDRLIKNDPENLTYQYRHAELLYALDDFDAAVKEWKRITRRHPTEVKALQALAEDAVTREAWDEALLYVQEEAGRRPLSVDSWLELGAIYQQLKSYPMAIAAADKALKLNPSSQEALFLKADALDQMNDLDGADRAYHELLERNPNSYRALEALQRVSEAKNEFDRAIRLVHTERKLAFSDSTSSPYLDIYEARLLADEGRIGRAMRLLHRKATHERISIPVLLYHGVSRFKRGERLSVPRDEFESQMEALKKGGYQPITVAQLAAYWEGKGTLPDKPILITFDDPRAEAVEASDPILKALGMRATMFVHFAPGFSRSRYYAQPDDLKTWASTGRWEMQPHSEQAHELVAIDQRGAKGSFLANREWLPKKGRLETEQEYRARVDANFKSAHDRMESLLPKGQPLAYAFRSRDMGETDFNNEPDAPMVNWEAAHHYFEFTFTQDQHGFNRVPTRVTDLHRWEVTPETTAHDLMQHLVTDEPWVRAKMEEADFWVRTNQPGRALAIYHDLHAGHGVDVAELYGGEALAFDMFGNGYQARKDWSDALDRDPSQQRYRDFSSFSQAKDSPDVGTDGKYFSDPFTRNTTVLLRSGAPVKAARVEGFAGRAIYGDAAGDAAVSANEYGGRLRWFLTPRTRLDADLTQRDFFSGASRKTNSGNGQLTFPFFAPFQLGVKGGVDDVETRQGVAEGLFYHAYGGLARWDIAVNTTLESDYEVDRYSDANTGRTASALLSRRFGSIWRAGYAFRYVTTDRRVSEYYSPLRAQLHTGLIGIDGSFGPVDARRNVHRATGSLTYSAGYGSEAGVRRILQGVKGDIGYRVVGDLSVNASVSYAQSPTYVSRMISAGLGLDF